MCETCRPQLPCIYFTDLVKYAAADVKSPNFNLMLGGPAARWSIKIKRGVGGEVKMHSTALSKSGFNWQLPRAGEKDGGVEDEEGDVQRDEEKTQGNEVKVKQGKKKN